MLSSTVCRYEHWSQPWFKAWMRRFGMDPDPTGVNIQRKHWEFCAIGQALEERGMLKPGNKGVAFAAGREFLPSAFAALGCDILATDLGHKEDRWNTQHSKSTDDLFYKRMVDRQTFDRLVSFQPADMTDIQGIEPGTYDFLWSSCAFEHLGSLNAGFDFVINAMKYLSTGGIAVHTTEYNISSNEETIEAGNDVIYRRRDIERLGFMLHKYKCGLEAVDFDCGVHKYDLDYDQQPFMEAGKPHIKLEIGGFVSTSILLIIHKG